MSEKDEQDWLAELAKGGEALRRQVEYVVQAAERFAAGGSTRTLAQRVALAVGADIRELLSPPERHAVGRSAINGTTAMVSVTAAAGLATASGSAAMPSVRVQAERNAGQILALVLLWLVVLAVPAGVMATNLSPKAQAMLGAYDAMLATLAVEITFRILDKRG